jgi:hypothetical protein
MNLASSQGLWRGLFGILGTGRNIGWLAVVEPYKAYLDETNIHDNAQWCFVAGHLGTEKQWEEFDGKWRQGLGRRKSLHMHDLQWRSKPDRITRLLGRLGPIPDSCKLERIFGSAKGKHYLDIVSQRPELGALFDPFTLALWPCVIETLRHLPRTERVIFTFEHNTKYSPLLALIENSLASEEIFTTPNGEQRAILVPIQKGMTPRTEPADYLAFEMGQTQIDHELKRKSFKAKAGASILGNHWMIGKQISRDQIRAICATTLALAHAQNVQMNKDIKEIIKMSKTGR